MADAQPVDPVPVAATRPAVRPLHIGNDGQAQGHRPRQRWPCGWRCCGGMRNIYDTRPGETYWAASDVGWVRRPLLHRLRAATARRDDRAVRRQARRPPPMRGAFWRVASEHGVKALFTAPTAIRAIKKKTPRACTSPSTTCRRLKYLFQAGERLDPSNLRLGVGHPRHPRSWTTGGRQKPAGALPPTRWVSNRCPFKPGSASVPMPGYDVRILRPDGSECEPNEEGAICVRLPLPPGALPTLWGDDDRYVSSYLSAVSRLLPDRGRRVHRSGRLPVCYGPHRRRDQRCGTPDVDGIDRGRAGRASGRRGSVR